MDAADALQKWRGERSFVDASHELRDRGVQIDPTYIRLLELRQRGPGLDMAFRLQAATGIPAESWREVVIHKPTLGAERTGVKGKKGRASRKPGKFRKLRNGAAS